MPNSAFMRINSYLIFSAKPLARMAAASKISELALIFSDSVVYFRKSGVTTRNVRFTRSPLTAGSFGTRCRHWA
jgi:hypothetical protein